MSRNLNQHNMIGRVNFADFCFLVNPVESSLMNSPCDSIIRLGTSPDKIMLAKNDRRQDNAYFKQKVISAGIHAVKCTYATNQSLVCCVQIHVFFSVRKLHTSRKALRRVSASNMKTKGCTKMNNFTETY